jgi:metallo-beta-lactamase family protein
MPDPVDPHPCDFVLSEATYGDRPHRPVEESRQEFEQAVKETIGRGGNVLIPSFALERSQDVLYYLHLMWDAGELPRCRIFLDSPLAVSITKAYERHLKALNPRLLAKLHAGENPFEFAGVEFTVSTEDSKSIQRWPSGSIIIAGSGMANGGRILHHLRHNLWRKDCSVVFVGYQAIGTPGRAIVDGARSIRIFGEEVAVHARIYTINGLSAHADQRGLVDWLRGTGKAAVRLVHGEQKSLEALAAAVRTELARKVSIAGFGEGQDV